MNASPILCAALFAASPSIAASQSFQYLDFTGATGLQFVERGAINGAILRVHDEIAPSGPTNRGAVWRDTPVAVAGGFDTTFVININENGGPSGGGDGMAFVIQNESVAGDTGGVGVNGIGRHASAMGYGIFVTSNPGESIDNSLVIEFDTFLNGNQPAAAPILDLDSNHISIHTGGTGENDQREEASIGRAGTAQLGVNMSDGLDHTVRVIYVPGSIEVYLDGNLVLTTPYDFATGGTYIDSGNPVGGLNLIGGTSAWVGFVGASGGSLENHDVISWTWDSGGPGTNYCMANVNSSGGFASMSAMTSASVSANDTTLMASGMPDLVFGFFISSQTQGFVMNPGGSEGNLCLGGAIGRYVGPGQIQQSDLTGSISLAIDLSMQPTPLGFVQVAAGETWNYQAWFRDSLMGQTTSNFTDGLALTFVN